MIIGALLHEAWGWSARHLAPIGLAFLAGWIWRGHAEKIDALKEAKAALEAEKAAAVTQIDSAVSAKVEALVREREAQTALLGERERFYAVLKQNRTVGTCRFDDADRERLRVIAEAASRFALGDVQGGAGGGAGGEGGPVAGDAARSSPR